ncbi:MAG: amidase [Pseudomonadota bacterium]
MAAFREYDRYDGLALADLVRKKEVKPLELVEAAVEKIEALNPVLNSVVTEMFDLAREQSARPLAGPLAGVPFLLKDIGPKYANVRMTFGSRSLARFVPRHDSELTTRLKNAGLIILGKTNTPEFGLLPVTEPELFGPCRNPWNTDLTPGGSSGGAAAAVAARMVPLAHGNDGGGSIRIPASCCGVFGLKPTRARNPLGPDFGDVYSGLVCDHALTLTVRDSAALLDATSGPDLGDPYWAPPPARPFLEETTLDPGRLRIAYALRPARDLPVHPDCVEAVKSAVTLLAELGHEVHEDQPALPGDALGQAFMAIWTAGVVMTMDAIGRGKPDPGMFEPLTWACYEAGKKVSAADYLNAVAALQAMGRTMARFLTGYDLLLTPTLAQPPAPLGAFTASPDAPFKAMAKTGEFAAFTPIANGTGQPAMSVPLFWNSDGLPIGVQFIARFGEEAALFRLAAQLEQARPWKDKKPPLAR